MRRASVPLLFVLVALIPVHGKAQESCARSGVCGGSFSDSLTFEAGACLDSETRRYEYFVFNVSVGATVTATVQSAFFAPEIQIINSDSVVVAADSNPSKNSRASASVTASTGGSWTARVRNIDVGTGGPFSLTIQCSTPPPPNGYALSISPLSLTLGRNETGSYRVTSSRAGSFSDSVTVSLSGFPVGVSADPQSFTLPAPGSGAQDVRLVTTDATPAGTFGIAAQGRSSSGLVSIAGATLVIDAPCTPPTILDQTRAISVLSGMSARLVVTAGGSPPFSAQWYKGFSPSPLFPVAGATSLEYQTEPLSTKSQFWVRLSNPCGSKDSATIDIAVSPTAPRRRAVRH